MGFGEKSCSPDCAATLAMQHRKRKHMMWFVYGSMGLAVALLVASYV